MSFVDDHQRKLASYWLVAPGHYSKQCWLKSLSPGRCGGGFKCVIGNLTIIGSDNGLSPDRRQAIIWTNAGLLLIGPLGINFSEILIEILTFSFKKMRLKVSSAKRRPFCLGLNVLRQGLVSSLTSSHYLNQSFFLLNWKHRNKFQWKLNKIFV